MPPQPLCEAAFAPLHSAGVLLPRWSCIVHGVGAALTRAGKLPPHRPPRPRPAAVPDRFAPAPALGPTQSKAGSRAKSRRRTDSEDLVRPAREDLGWFDDRGFGQREVLGGYHFNPQKNGESKEGEN